MTFTQSPLTAGRATMARTGLIARVPLTPDGLVAPITPTVDTIVLCHLGVPQVVAEDWTLMVDGLVGRPKRFDLAALKTFAVVEMEAVHQCAGSPLAPRVPTRRVCNVVWGGVRLADVLAACGVGEGARYLWSEGADWGEFAGETVAAYAKDLPLERALHPDSLLAFAMNGAPLTAEHGYPVRLVVPGYFGTNSVKWLERLTLADRRVDSRFTTRFYNDPVLDADGLETGASTPVWALQPEAVIVAPAPGATMARGLPHAIHGWAWGDRPITRVAVSTDDGATWRDSQPGARAQRGWQKFSVVWTPDVRGPATLRVRATDAEGVTQPDTGQRNAVHTVSVSVD